MITEDEYITTDKYLSFANESVAYIKTDVLVYGKPIVWRGFVHTGRPAETWITGHSDYSITSDIHKKFQQSCKKWYAVNKEADSPNLYALPIGITNNCDDHPEYRIYGNTSIMHEVANMPRTIENRVYLNFSIHTYPVERGFVYNMFKDKPWVTVGVSEPTLESRKKYLIGIRNHDFMLCPRGNGIDTYRLWETLYMGGIPIVKRNFALLEFEDLPICWINTWDDVTPEFLDKEKKRIESSTWNLEKLKISYWKNKITGRQ